MKSLKEGTLKCPHKCKMAYSNGCFDCPLYQKALKTRIKILDKKRIKDVNPIIGKHYYFWAIKP